MAISRNIHSLHLAIKRVDDILKHSIIRRLLIVVFSIYLLVTVTLTFLHMDFEYKFSEREVVASLKNIQAMVHDSLSQAIWEFNTPQLNSILHGLLSNQYVVGAKLEIPQNDTTQEMHSQELGLVPGPNGTLAYVDPQTYNTQPVSKALERLIPNVFDITYTDSLGRKLTIGTMSLYSSNRVVFAMVKQSYILIILNAIIKTIALWVFFLWAGYYFISKPLVQLTDAVKQLASGHWSTELTYSEQNREPKTEINTLFDAFNDMTKKLQQAQNKLNDLAQTEKLASVGASIAGVAHEINNPLGSIMQSAQNIQRRIDPTLTANQQVAEQLHIDLNKQYAYLEQREIIGFLNNIHSAGERASNIVKNMLKFTRRSTTDMQPHDLVEIINDALELCTSDIAIQDHIDFKNITINKNFALQNLMVECFTLEMQQVLLNLLRNAVQAMDPQQAQKLITIALSKNDDKAVIKVSDNGQGMSKAIMAQIFQPFFTTKPEGQGTGLGLSVCRNIIVQKHHGNMDVESSVGQGTTFIITLPITQPRGG